MAVSSDWKLEAFVVNIKSLGMHNEAQFSYAAFLQGHLVPHCTVQSKRRWRRKLWPVLFWAPMNYYSTVIISAPVEIPTPE